MKASVLVLCLLPLLAAGQTRYGIPADALHGPMRLPYYVKGVGNINVSGHWTQATEEIAKKLPPYIVYQGDTLDRHMLESGTALGASHDWVMIHTPAYEYQSRDNKAVRLTHKEYRTILERLNRLEKRKP